MGWFGELLPNPKERAKEYIDYGHMGIWEFLRFINEQSRLGKLQFKGYTIGQVPIPQEYPNPEVYEKGILIDYLSPEGTLVTLARSFKSGQVFWHEILKITGYEPEFIPPATPQITNPWRRA